MLVVTAKTIKHINSSHLAGGLHSRGKVHSVTEQAVLRHTESYDTSNNTTGMHACNEANR